jgi:hypothetical protein
MKGAYVKDAFYEALGYNNKPILHINNIEASAAGH